MEKNKFFRREILRGTVPFCRFAAVFALLGLLLGGCCSKPPEKESQKDVSAELAASFCRGDAKHFIACLPPEVKKDFGEKEFAASRKKVCSQLGKPQKKQLLGKLQHPLFDIRLWKITFERQDSSGMPIRQDALFQVVCGKSDNGGQVVSFGFL